LPEEYQVRKNARSIKPEPIGAFELDGLPLAAVAKKDGRNE
jgi:hypothetical protein